MTSTASRFFYIVRPALGQWEVTFGEGGSCFLYSTQAEAIDIALGAARSHWEKHGVPSGVRLAMPGRAGHTVRTFGETTEASPRSMP
jgi:hypothetical protein